MFFRSSSDRHFHQQMEECHQATFLFDVNVRMFWIVFLTLCSWKQHSPLHIQKMIFRRRVASNATNILLFKGFEQWYQQSWYHLKPSALFRSGFLACSFPVDHCNETKSGSDSSRTYMKPGWFAHAFVVAEIGLHGMVVLFLAFPKESRVRKRSIWFTSLHVLGTVSFFGDREHFVRATTTYVRTSSPIFHIVYINPLFLVAIVTCWYWCFKIQHSRKVFDVAMFLILIKMLNSQYV